MFRLYLDIETYREGDIFIDEKIIAIGVIEDWTPYTSESLKEPQKVYVSLYSEWELGSEEAVVRKFYGYLESLTRTREEQPSFLDVVGSIVVVGFNILRFDIPLLKQKVVEYGVVPLPKLNKLWNDVLVIDLCQVALPLNGMRFRGNSLENLAKLLRDHGFNVPELIGRGEDIPKLYRARKYGEIEEHLRRDLEVVRYIDLALMSRFYQDEALIARLREVMLKSG